jgi:two-component system sensor histidine kinase GlrK
VTVRIAYVDGTARLSVEDEGPGIAAADVARIWAPFARLPQASAAGVAGAGIGLSVVRELTQLHGGRVTVTTGASGGARFCVELPHAIIGQADAQADAPRATDDAAALPAARSLPA